MLLKKIVAAFLVICFSAILTLCLSVIDLDNRTQGYIVGTTTMILWNIAWAVIHNEI
jgi:hypothetical protein